MGLHVCALRHGHANPAELNFHGRIAATRDHHVGYAVAVGKVAPVVSREVRTDDVVPRSHQKSDRARVVRIAASHLITRDDSAPAVGFLEMNLGVLPGDHIVDLSRDKRDGSHRYGHSSGRTGDDRHPALSVVGLDVSPVVARKVAKNDVCAGRNLHVGHSGLVGRGGPNLIAWDGIAKDVALGLVRLGVRVSARSGGGHDHNLQAAVSVTTRVRQPGGQGNSRRKACRGARDRVRGRLDVNRDSRRGVDDLRGVGLRLHSAVSGSRIPDDRLCGVVNVVRSGLLGLVHHEQNRDDRNRPDDERQSAKRQSSG